MADQAEIEFDLKTVDFEWETRKEEIAKLFRYPITLFRKKIEDNEGLLDIEPSDWDNELEARLNFAVFQLTVNILKDLKSPILEVTESNIDIYYNRNLSVDELLTILVYLSSLVPNFKSQIVKICDNSFWYGMNDPNPVNNYDFKLNLEDDEHYLDKEVEKKVIEEDYNGLI